ncbi:MAG: hypothetical protein FWG92_03050 [Leptospirales bacterium]|nr:hypothetical protein [Leptospirales bacterium]
MKKIIICFLMAAAAGTISVKVLFADYDISGDIYLCDESAFQAEFSARVIANRAEMTRASFCRCDQVPNENRDKVKKIRWEKQGYVFEFGSCEPPKNRVYRCYCVGRSTY